MAGEFEFPAKLLGAMQACENDKIKAMLNDDLVKAKDEWGTLLHHAVRKKNLEIIPHLIERGCDLNALGKYGETALMAAVMGNQSQSAKILYEAGSNLKACQSRGHSLLQRVFGNQTSSCRIIQIFLVEIMGTAATRLKTEKIVDKLIDLKSTLYHAACTGEIEVIEAMLQRGFDANSKGNKGKTALHSAVQLGDLNLVKWLILKGVDVNALDKSGYGALSIAANIGDLDIVKLLLSHRANPNGARMTKNGRKTALYRTFLAANKEVSEDRYDQCAECLLRNGAIPRNPPFIHLHLFSPDLTGIPLMPQTIVDWALHQRNYKRLQLLVCHLVILQMGFGRSFADAVLVCTIERYRPKLEVYKRYYLMCQGILKTLMCDKWSLLDLLIESDCNMKQLVGNEEFLFKIDEVCSKIELCRQYPYYYSILVKRVTKAKLLVAMEDALLLD